ncbi:S8/S53 family peptidase [Actinoplanes sp. NPDC051859]|uniref:S8/S53 family peptidase n=1 Tax=Actinoplanes sp. NPDC051859 TaxID=3363909 RepID=UPI00379B87FF
MTIASDWPIPDTRDAGQLAHDQQDVRRQVAVLASAQQDIVERIRVRRRTAGRPFQVVTTGDDRLVLTAENQLVVDATADQLGRLGTLLPTYASDDVPGRSERRRTRVLRCRNARTERELRADARRLRDNGITACPNLLLPLGYVIKGKSYPGVTSAPGPYASNGAQAPVRVAVIDTGLTDQARTDAWDTGLVRQGTDILDLVAPKNRIDWMAGHGTFAAGIVRQLAPDCEVVVYRFTGPDGLGTDEAAAETLIRAVDEAGDRRLVINASFGAPAVDGVPPLAMQEAVEYVHSAYPKALIVASAGNDGADLPLYPAAYPGVKAVGALNADLTPAVFSNRGSWVHCSAVGVGVVSTFVRGLLPPEEGVGADIPFGDNSWATWSGTSFSAPQISGAVAALCGEDPALTPRSAFDQLVGPRPTLAGFGTVVHLLPGTPLP